MESFTRAATVVGYVAIARFLFIGVGFLRLHCARPARPLSAYRRAGQAVYGVVTGASAGIGLGIAQALVRAGFHVVLLGHLEWELDEAAAGLRTIRPDVVVRTVVMNVRTATPEEMERAVADLADLEISVLVNNVGGTPIAPPLIRPFGTYSLADVDAVIDHNARFMARWTNLMLPLLAHGTSRHRRSLIISMSSLSIFGSPWFVMYSATKAFNAVFSVALSRELRTEAATRYVETLAIVPGDVRSQANNCPDTDAAPRWDSFGQSIVSKAEYAASRRIRVISPHWFHDLQYRLFDLLPEWVTTKGITDIMRIKKAQFEQQAKEK